jgi:hypothetical protein
MIDAPLKRKAFGIWFKDLARWDVTFFRKVSWHWPQQYISPLSKALSRKQIEVTVIKDITHIPIIEKISFGGVLSITDVDDRKGYKGRLFWASSGDLIYSKIRVEQGSLAIVPDEVEQVAVSPVV